MHWQSELSPQRKAACSAPAAAGRHLAHRLTAPAWRAPAASPPPRHPGQARTVQPRRPLQLPAGRHRGSTPRTCRAARLLLPGAQAGRRSSGYPARRCHLPAGLHTRLQRQAATPAAGFAGAGSAQPATRCCQPAAGGCCTHAAPARCTPPAKRCLVTATTGPQPTAAPPLQQLALAPQGASPCRVASAIAVSGPVAAHCSATNQMQTCSPVAHSSLSFHFWSRGSRSATLQAYRPADMVQAGDAALIQCVAQNCSRASRRRKPHLLHR